MEQNRTCRLHFFPDIPVDGSTLVIGEQKSSDNGGNGFRRMMLGRQQTPVPPALGKNSDLERKKEAVSESRTVDVKKGSEEKKEIEKKTELIERQAYEEGFCRGEKDGFNKVETKLAPVLKNFKQALCELEKLKKELCRKAEEETVELALAIAKKIVGHEVATNKEIISHVVKEALKKAEDQEKIRIRVNPTDMEMIRDPEFKHSEMFTHIHNITFEEDDSISAGGCVIETDFGNIDARIENQLNTVEETFKSELKKIQTRG
jgi:flagellar assembly protein FliH